MDCAGNVMPRMGLLFAEIDDEQVFTSSLERWAERMADDPGSVPMEIVHLMQAALDSLEPRRSMIRTRRGQKRKRK